MTYTAEEPAVSPAPDSDRGQIADMRRHTARGMLVNGAFDLGLIGLTALRGLVVAAFLTRADYGVWGLLGLTMWTALMLKNQFGAGNKYVQQNEPDQALAFQKAFTVELIFALAVAPPAALVVVAYALISGHSFILLPGLVLLLMILGVALEFPFTAYYRRMDYARQRRLQAVDPVVSAVTVIALAIAGAGYWSFVGGVLAGSFAGAGVALAHSPYPLRLRFEAVTLRSYVSFSAPLLIAGLAGLTMFQVVYLVGNDAVGLAGLGAFTLVGNFVQFTDQADATITQTLYPAVCAAADRLETLAEVFVKSNRISLMWAVPFGVGLSLFCVDLFRYVIGARWLPAATLMEIMGIVTAVHHVGYNWGAFFLARGRTWPIAWGAVIPVLAFVALAVPLVYADGLTGLAIAFAGGELVSLGVRAVFLHRMFVGFRLESQLFSALLPSALAALPILGLRGLGLGERSLPGAIAMFALYVVLTLAATWLTERSLVVEALGYLRGRGAAAAQAAG